MVDMYVYERSRICVKNLPKYVAEDRLRELFSQKGEVTDAKLMRTEQFGFVGFRTEREAEEAIRYFNKSLMDTCRITCEVWNTLEPNVSEGKTEDGSGDRSADPSSSPGNKHDEVLESGRLFIRNLPYSATEEELQDHFSKYGTISQVHIVIDKDTRRSMGLAYVLFSIPEAAARALKEMGSSIFQGRLLHVMPAKQKNQSDVPEINNASKTLKQQRISERKESEATGNIRAWNTLFMHPDTIVESIARKYGVSKSELLDRESDDLAVRVALGETQVIAETKKALSNAGVNISSLEEFATGKTDGLKRSNHVILVKNLPYGSSEGELSEKFGKFGSLDKIILPPTKTLAVVVVFLEPADARAALKGLAYKRYKDAPLYLEWAPGRILSQTSNVGDNKIGELDVKRALLERQVEDMTDTNVDPVRIEVTLMLERFSLLDELELHYC